jgi:transcriptional regulator with XRE-family HTH domain
MPKRPDELTMSIGRTIKFVRASSGLRQKELADQLGVTQNYLSLVENDKREPSLSFLRGFAEEMKIPLGLLFLDMENQTETSFEERVILMRIKDLIFEIERVRCRHEAASEE